MGCRRAGPSSPPSRSVAPAAALALLAVLVYAVPVSSGERIRASVELTDATAPPKRTVDATVRVDPPEAADDAHWFVSTAWQGREGRSVVDPLEELRPGVWRTTKPVPVYGTWKASLRLHKDGAVQGPCGLLPGGRGDPGRRHSGAAELHAQLRPRQGAAPARAEARRLAGAHDDRLPDRRPRRDPAR